MPWRLVKRQSSFKHPAYTIWPPDPALLKRKEVEGRLAGVEGVLCDVSAPAEFPAEIVQMILNFCPTETLKNARLACWALADTLGRLLFEKITIVPHLYFLEKFIYTFQRSELRNHVRKVLFDFCWVGQLLTKAALRDAGSKRPHASSVNTLEEFNNFYKRGQEANVSSLESAMLATALTLTPFLETVEVDFESDLDHWGRFNFEETRWPIPPPIFVSFLESIGADAVDLRDLELESMWHVPDRLPRSLATALGTRASKLSNLILHRFDPSAIQGGARPVMDFTFFGYSATMFVQALSRISHLDFRLSDHDDREDPLRFSTVVASILRKASHLSSPMLHAYETFTCQWDAGEGIFDIGRPILARFVLPQISPGTFPVLKSLWLQNGGLYLEGT